MPISVKCCDCGKALKAPDALAGKMAKCPDCGAVVIVPDAREFIQADDPRQTTVDELDEESPDVPRENGSARTPCPMCGELIAVAAVKCRFCGELLSRPASRRVGPRPPDPFADQLTGTDIALCVCFPIGCIAGIISMITGRPSRGLKMIGLAFAMPFLWAAILSIFN
jgi:predicted RNA-binding Zn-ribbon protein involved in translation (DUF1610 family)